MADTLHAGDGRGGIVRGGLGHGEDPARNVGSARNSGNQKTYRAAGRRSSATAKIGHLLGPPRVSACPIHPHFDFARPVSTTFSAFSEGSRRVGHDDLHCLNDLGASYGLRCEKAAPIAAILAVPPLSVVEKGPIDMAWQRFLATTQPEKSARKAKQRFGSGLESLESRAVLSASVAQQTPPLLSEIRAAALPNAAALTNLGSPATTGRSSTAAVQSLAAATKAPMVPIAFPEGVYRPDALKSRGRTVYFFAVRFTADFTTENMQAVARQGMNYVLSRKMSLAWQNVGNKTFDASIAGNTHMVIGFVCDNGETHWTGVRVYNRTSIFYSPMGGPMRFSTGWVRQERTISTGSKISYQFCDNDRGGFGWEAQPR